MGDIQLEHVNQLLYENHDSENDDLGDKYTITHITVVDKFPMGNLNRENFSGRDFYIFIVLTGGIKLNLVSTI